MMKLIRSTSHNTDRSRGQALVEFALIIPIFILMVMGIFDIGRAVYAYNTINNAAREASRLAIVDQTLPHIRTEGAGRSANLGVTAAQVAVDFRTQTTPAVANSCSTLAIGCIANVRIPYTYQAFTPIIGAIIGPLQLVGESKFTVEAVCVEPTQPQCPKGN